MLLAQNIKTCFADNFETCIHWSVESMVNVSDDLQNSRSLFMQEVVRVKTMIDKSANDGNLFLLDELFKGTNTIERIAAAKAVLSQLVNKNNIVIVSTHDIELTEFLKSQFELYHFCESFSNNEIVFDYLLKDGILTDFNALKILQASGYDEKIINDAYQITSKLRTI